MAASRSLPLALASALEGFSGWHTLLRCQIFHYHIIRQAVIWQGFPFRSGAFPFCLDACWVRTGSPSPGGAPRPCSAWRGGKPARVHIEPGCHRSRAARGGERSVRGAHVFILCDGQRREARLLGGFTRQRDGNHAFHAGG